MSSLLQRQFVSLDTSGPDERACLFFAAGKLVAIVVQLADEHNAAMAGKWFLERGFGALDRMEHPLFDDLDCAERWIAANLALSLPV